MARKYDVPSLNIYLNELRNYKSFPNKKETDLIIKAKQGDSKAYQEIINHNLRFVFFVAKKTLLWNMPLEDRIQAGSIGLLKAFEKYDVSQGVKFISFAAKYIWGYMVNEYKNNYYKQVRRPVNVIQQNIRTKRLVEKLCALYEHDQLSETLINKEFARKHKPANKKEKSPYKQFVYNEASLDPHRNYERISTLSLIDILEDTTSKKPNSFITPESQKIIYDLIINSLTEKQGEVLRLSFGNSIFAPMNDSEIGEFLEKTDSAVQLLRTRAIKNSRLSKGYYQKIYGM